MFEGVYTALVTPFRNGAIDEEGLRQLIEVQIEAGIDGLVPCGSTGESATLSHEEHERVIELCVEAAAGRVPVMAGTGSNSTAEAISLTAHAKRAGAQAALLLSPYYNKPTQEGIYAHFAEIARQTDFPLVIYNIPGRTASNIQAATLARLSRLPEVVGAKEACGDVDQIAHLIAQTPPDFDVLAGDDSLTLPILSVGGKGVISVTSNIAPRTMIDLVRSFRSGDTARALEIHQRLLPLFDALFCETNPIPIKTAVALWLGLDDEIRLPLTPLTEPNRERLQVVMKDLGILR